MAREARRAWARLHAMTAPRDAPSAGEPAVATLRAYAAAASALTAPHSSVQPSQLTFVAHVHDAHGELLYCAAVRPEALAEHQNRFYGHVLRLGPGLDEPIPNACPTAERTLASAGRVENFTLSLFVERAAPGGKTLVACAMPPFTPLKTLKHLPEPPRERRPRWSYDGEDERVMEEWLQVHINAAMRRAPAGNGGGGRLVVFSSPHKLSRARDVPATPLRFVHRPDYNEEYTVEMWVSLLLALPPSSGDDAAPARARDVTAFMRMGAMHWQETGYEEHVTFVEDVTSHSLCGRRSACSGATCDDAPRSPPAPL